MANRIVGNVYIIDSGLISLTDGLARHVASVALYATDTTGELQITLANSTADTIIHLRNNQNQPFTLPLYLGGVVIADTLRVQTLNAGTGFLYLM